MCFAAPAFAQSPPSARIFGTEDDPRTELRPAEQIVMRLDYTRAEGCPDDAAVRATIGAQVKRWDPFAPAAPWLLTVLTVHGGDGYRGSAELRDVGGVVRWTRPLIPRARCIELVEDLAIALAFKINPPRVAQPAPAEPPPAPTQPPAPATPAELPVLPEHQPGPAFRLGAGTWMDLATAPRPAFGLTVDAGVRVAWFSVAGELHWNPPAGAGATADIDVSTTRLMGALVPCAHFGSFAGGGSLFGCGALELGQIRGTIAKAGAVATPDHQASLYGTAGGRFGIEVPLVAPRRLFLRIAVSMAGVPARPRFLAGTISGGVVTSPPEKVWESPAFIGGLGVGLLASF
jgi:hypothetical protein